MCMLESYIHSANYGQQLVLLLMRSDKHKQQSNAAEKSDRQVKADANECKENRSSRDKVRVTTMKVKDYGPTRGGERQLKRQSTKTNGKESLST